jgi:hypothetical protein
MVTLAWLRMSEGSCPGDAGETAALVLATQEFGANSGEQTFTSAPPECWIAGPDEQPWLQGVGMAAERSITELAAP